MLQSSSSNYDKSAILSQEEIDIIHNMQEELFPGKSLRELIKNFAIIDKYTDELRKILKRLENSMAEPLPSNLPFAVIDTFDTSIETIHNDIREAIKLLNKAAGNAEEINRIQLGGQVAKKDPIDIDTNRDLFEENIERCRQSLTHAEKIATGLLRDAGAKNQNPNEMTG